MFGSIVIRYFLFEKRACNRILKIIGKPKIIQNINNNEILKVSTSKYL